LAGILRLSRLHGLPRILRRLTWILLHWILLHWILRLLRIDLLIRVALGRNTGGLFRSGQNAIARPPVCHVETRRLLSTIGCGSS
jgi:hypothetical protein